MELAFNDFDGKAMTSQDQDPTIVHSTSKIQAAHSVPLSHFIPLTKIRNLMLFTLESFTAILLSLLNINHLRS